jgi:NADPH:quinone reductase-like Zn-dependent oxidoreductase
MKAAIVAAIGDPPSLGQRPEPLRESDRDALIRVSAAALNPVDLLIASGTHPLGRPKVPYVPGIEGVGTVIEGSIHPPGTRVRVQVAAGLVDGTLAEVVRAPAEVCVEVPPGLPDEAAAAVGVVGVSAYLGLGHAGLSAGEDVLVLGATGALGQAAIRAARALGAGRVIAAGRDLTRLAALDGADARITLDDTDLREQLDTPVDLVVDPLWGRYAAAAIGCLAPGGRYLNFGSIDGGTSDISAHQLRASRLSIIGFSATSSGSGEVADAYWAIADLAAAGRFAIATERYDLADVTTAWKRQASSPGAKVLIVP